MLPIYHDYPYHDLHDLNLDMILAEIKKLMGEMDDFKVINTIRFYGDWDITKGYPAWSIVSDPNHDGYISIKPVPPGVDIYNTDYWILVANYSALYADMQNRIIALEGRADNVDGEIFDIGAELDILQSANTGRNFLFIADSYGMRSTSQPTWTEILTGIYSNSRHKSVSSIGFTTGSTDPNDSNYNFNFIGQLREFYSELTQTERNAVTDIVVCGGWNDARSLTQGIVDGSTFVSRIYDFVDYATANFVNARVWIGFIGWQTIDCVQPDTTLSDLIIAQRLYEEAVRENLYHLANISCVMKNSEYFDITFFHPNPSGSAKLAYAIGAALSGGYTFNYRKTLSASDFTVATGAAATFSRGSITVNNNVATIKMLLTGVTTNSVSEILTFNDDVLPGGGNKTVDISAVTFSAGKGCYSVIQNKTLLSYTAISNETMLIEATYNVLYDT